MQYSIGALSKAIYERMFLWLVERINKTLETKVGKYRNKYYTSSLPVAVTQGVPPNPKKILRTVLCIMAKKENNITYYMTRVICFGRDFPRTLSLKASHQIFINHS